MLCHLILVALLFHGMSATANSAKHGDFLYQQSDQISFEPLVSLPAFSAPAFIGTATLGPFSGTCFACCSTISGKTALSSPEDGPVEHQQRENEKDESWEPIEDEVV